MSRFAKGTLNVVEDELKAYRKTGRPLHLAHAARALQDLQSLCRGRRTHVHSQGGLREPEHTPN